MARLKTQFDFMAGMYFNGALHFNKYSLMIDFYTLGDIPQDHSIGVERLSYFIYDVAARAIFIHEDDLANTKLFAKAGIPVLTVPGPGPLDPVVLATLVTKMNAILEETLVISDAELTSVVGDLMTYVWDSADDDDEIHGIVNDTDEAKWWATSAPRFASYHTGADVDEIEEAKPFPVTWKMLDLLWTEDEDDADDDEPVSKKKTKGKIIKADFTGKNTKKK